MSDPTIQLRKASLALKYDISTSNCVPGFPTPLVCIARDDSAIVAIAMLQHHQLISILSFAQDAVLLMIGGFLLSAVMMMMMMMITLQFSQFCALEAILPARKAKTVPLQKRRAQNSGKEVRLERQPKMPLEIPWLGEHTEIATQ
jgi:hypothetical protein